MAAGAFSCLWFSSILEGSFSALEVTLFCIETELRTGLWLLSSLFATEKQYASNIESWELGHSSDESPRSTKELFRRRTCFRVGGEIALKGAREDEPATTLGDAAGIVDMIPS